MSGSATTRVLHAVNAATGASWQLESRFATGVLGGAWRIRDGAEVGVLKWHGPGSPAPYNTDAPVIAEFLRGAGYPTPAWRAWGVTPDGLAWWVQELVDGAPLRELDVAAAEIFVRLVVLQRALTPPTGMSWNPYVRAQVFGGSPSHRRLAGAGGPVRQLLEEAVALGRAVRVHGARRHRDGAR